MNKYRVELVQTVWEKTYVTVEAETEEEAETIALEKSLDAEWTYDETVDREAVNIVKLKKEQSA